VIGVHLIHFSKNGISTIHNHKPNIYLNIILKCSGGFHKLKERLKFIRKYSNFQLLLKCGLKLAIILECLYFCWEGDWEIPASPTLNERAWVGCP